MARKDIGIQLDRNNLNNHNDNYEELYNDFKEVVNRVSDEAFNKVIAGSRINWSQMVDTVNDLPSSVNEGETRGVKSDNKIYRYDGSNWIAIAEINLNPITEVDDRLTTQLAETVLGINNNTTKIIRDSNGRAVEIKEKKDGNTVKKTEITRENNKVLSVIETVLNKSVKYTYHRENGRVMNITKEVL